MIPWHGSSLALPDLTINQPSDTSTRHHTYRWREIRGVIVWTISISHPKYPVSLHPKHWPFLLTVIQSLGNTRYQGDSLCSYAPSTPPRLTEYTLHTVAKSMSILKPPDPPAVYTNHEALPHNWVWFRPWQLIELLMDISNCEIIQLWGAAAQSILNQEFFGFKP